MTLGEIDKRKTLDATRNFLDKRLDHYLNMSGSRRFELKSPIISNTPPTKTNVNKQDQIMMNIFYAESIVGAVAKTIDKCSNDNRHPYKAILIDFYISRLTFGQVAIRVGYSYGYTKRLRNNALIEFAERFTTQQVLDNIDPVINLIAYKNVD